MSRRSLGRLTRNAEAALLLESFLVAAVASFLGIRWFLASTGYPQVGSNGIHIAHMLWGGLLMLLAVMLLLAYLDRSVLHVAAVIAGLGFGTFIDEIGKFVTADNDYFYRPAVALIYIVFVGGFLVGRALIGQQRPLTEDEALANALHQLGETSSAGIGPDDRMRIERLLERADPGSARTKLAREYLAAIPVIATPETMLERGHRRLIDGYESVMAKPWAEQALMIGVVLYAAAAVVGVTFVAVSTPVGAPGGPSSFATVAQVLSTIAGAACVGVGVLRLRRSRAAAFRWFRRGVLVWILITQVFVFYSSQLAGLGGLVVDLVAYAGLTFALTRERTAGRDPRNPSASSPSPGR